MPKYKVDFCVVRVEGNKFEVKDNNGKLCWYHISDVKKTDMVTKLVRQLPDVDSFGRKGRLSFGTECVQNLGWAPEDWKFRFNPDYVQDISDMVQNGPKQRSHLMQLRSVAVNETEVREYTIRLFNAVEYIRHYNTLSWIKS